MTQTFDTTAGSLEHRFSAFRLELHDDDSGDFDFVPSVNEWRLNGEKIDSVMAFALLKSRPLPRRRRWFDRRRRVVT